MWILVLDFSKKTVILTHMKITLTTHEAASFIREKMNLPSNATVEIVDKITATDAFVADTLAQVEMHLFNKNKIAAIRAYRDAYCNELGFLGLKEAKDVVENWSDAKEKMLAKNGFVFPVYDSNKNSLLYFN